MPSMCHCPKVSHMQKTASPGRGTTMHAAFNRVSGAECDALMVPTTLRYMQMRRHGWWRGPAVTSWAQYRIVAEKLPSGCSPLLVFLNTKSGAQVGAMMRRRFLRLLNPLQVRPPVLHSARLHANGTPTPQSVHLPAKLSASKFMTCCSVSTACQRIGGLLVCS